MRRVQSELLLKADAHQRHSESLDVVTMEDLIEACHPLGYDAERAEWAFRVITSFGFPRRELGVLLFRLRDDGQIGVRLD